MRVVVCSSSGGRGGGVDVRELALHGVLLIVDAVDGNNNITNQSKLHPTTTTNVRTPDVCGSDVSQEHGVSGMV